MPTALDPFSMFMLTTGPAFLKDDESIVNAVVKNSYLLPRFMEGKPMEVLLQGGTKIQDIIYLEEDSDAEWYKASAQDFDYRNQQVGTAWEGNWRFLKNSTSWTDHEVGLNEGGGLSDRIGRFHRFKRISKLRYMNLWTTQIHKIEDSFTATPNNAEMEVGDGSLPYSLFCSINEGTNGLPTGFTTVQGIGTDKARWRNQQVTYAGGTTTAEQWWTAMRTLHSRCRFERLPKYGSYSEPTRSPTFYAVSLWGLVTAESFLRSENNTGRSDLYMAGRQDASFPAPMFHGVPFVYISNLDTAAVFGTGVDTIENGGGGHFAGPRVVAVQGSCINFVMHRDRVIKRLPPFSPDRQPFKKVMVTDTWCNTVNTNRREHGIMSPAADFTTVPVPAAGV